MWNNYIYYYDYPTVGYLECICTKKYKNHKYTSIILLEIESLGLLKDLTSRALSARLLGAPSGSLGPFAKNALAL